MLEIKSLDHLCNISEPVGIVLVNIGLTPISISRKVFSYLVHVIEALLLVISPNLSLLVNKVREYVLEYVFEFR